MIFTAPAKVKETSLDFSQMIQRLHNGLFRCPLDVAHKYMPELTALFLSAPVSDPENYEIDVKIHMLMAGQYPCIPNWHCDNVPRFDGQVSYKDASDDHNMLLWISGSPATEFLSGEYAFNTPLSHADLADQIRQAEPDMKKINGNCWYSMSQKTPHRGTMATENTWRIFARITHKSVTPVRPVTDYIRKHSQVYLDANFFSW